jgi:hypothetical protein
VYGGVAVCVFVVPHLAVSVLRPELLYLSVFV